MSKRPQYFADDNTLALIVREDPNQEVFDIAYATYRIPFISFFHQYYELEIEQAEDIFGQAFSVLYHEVHSKVLEEPFQTTLFSILLSIGFLYLEEKRKPFNGRRVDQILNKLKRPYYEADIMLLLVRHPDEVAFELIHAGFKEPTFRLLRKKFDADYDRLSFDPEEYYQTATKTLKEKIAIGPPKGPEVPMKAMLFTYFFKIAYWKYLNFTKKKKKRKWLQEDREWDELSPPKEEERAYLDQLIDSWAILQKYQFENEKELVEAFAKELGEEPMQLLQYLMEGKKYREISEITGKTEGAIRKMAFDSRKKIRKMLGI